MLSVNNKQEWNGNIWKIVHMISMIRIYLNINK